MNQSLRKRVLKRFLRDRKSSQAGFTLTEILIAAIVAGLVISGLLYLVVELLQVDLRESARNETQREMQNAMDYMATELREAVYVYTGDCLNGGAGCPGIAARLPAEVSGPTAVPVLAFWKHQRYPAGLRAACGTTPGLTIGGRAVGCITGSSYALVVYSVTTDNPTDIWQGRSRIVRYALPEFTENGATWVRTPGYRNPADATVAAPGGGAGLADPFSVWQPADPGRLQGGTTAVLVDFVDSGEGAQAAGINFPANRNALCPPDSATTPPTQYSVSPPATGTLPNEMGFYACVRPYRAGFYQDVTLFLRGDAFGRPSIFEGAGFDSSFLTTLETRVLTRGVLDRIDRN
ncbi:prepilin-type N-terminal cleavage/methylation domain-containing protein [Leptolyngbya sp. AN02str]|uniref:prepilin-type N-terminal cleavage/methylation domain-containing protein n=1 Tax=Leptolyngbya sp. AN02str TaxID=3423363 RepID=UPI003D316FA9